MLRRRFLLTLPTALSCLQAQTRNAPALVFVLIDASLTIPDMKAFRTAWKTIMDRSVGGDRVVVAVISGRVGNRQNSIITEIGDRDLPVKGWNDNPLIYDENFATAKKLSTDDFEAALTKPRTDRTELLRSIRDAARYFAAEKKRRKILVILSDMLEDSAEYRFEKIALSETFTNTAIANAKKQMRLPDLHQVDVYTQVPGVAPPEKAEQVEQFWIRYFAACGANISQQTYSTLSNYRRL